MFYTNIRFKNKGSLLVLQTQIMAPSKSDFGEVHMTFQVKAKI